MRKKSSFESQDDALPSELIDDVLASESSDPPYCAATKDEQVALISECGRERVKGLEGFRNMLLSDIRKALSK